MPNTREKLIELLECTYGQVDDRDYDCYGECKTCQAEHLIANGVGFLPKWIPVSERLPELYKSVLAYDEEDKTVIRWYDKNGFNIVDEYGYTYPVKTVTHWMPLPEAPKGE